MTKPEPDPEVRAINWVNRILKRKHAESRLGKREFVECVNTSRELRRNVRARLREYGLKAKDTGDALHVKW